MRKFKTTTLKDLLENQEDYRPEAVVSGLINHKELILLSAQAKTGKSLLSMNLALAVASGKLFLGRFEVTPGPVMIIQTEVSEYFLAERVKSMLSNEPCNDFTTQIIVASGSFKIDEGMDSLKELIDVHHPKLLILDPFYTLHTKDENSASEMAPVLQALRDLVLETNIACVLIHHQGKRGEKTSSSTPGHSHRGSSAFADVPDGSLSLTKKPDGTFTLHAELRNQKPFDGILLKLNQSRLIFEPLNSTAEARSPKRDKIFADIMRDANAPLKQSELLRRFQEITGLSDKPSRESLKVALELQGIEKFRKDGVLYCRSIQSVEMIDPYRNYQNDQKDNDSELIHG